MFAALVRALVVLTVMAAAPAKADNYPSRNVELIVPFAAGGGTDLLARLMSEGLGKQLYQSFIPLNRPGANTNTGTLQAVKSAPDGYTLVMASIGLAANPSLYKRLAFNPLVSTIGWYLPQLFSGSLIVATVMNLPNVGPLLLRALINQDMYLAGGILLIYSFLTVVGTLLSDVLLATIDPRIRVEG
mgnify:CR=1 FL=1